VRSADFLFFTVLLLLISVRCYFFLELDGVEPPLHKFKRDLFLKEGIAGGISLAPLVRSLEGFWSLEERQDDLAEQRILTWSIIHEHLQLLQESIPQV